MHGAHSSLRSAPLHFFFILSLSSINQDSLHIHRIANHIQVLYSRTPPLSVHHHIATTIRYATLPPASISCFNTYYFFSLSLCSYASCAPTSLVAPYLSSLFLAINSLLYVPLPPPTTPLYKCTPTHSSIRSLVYSVCTRSSPRKILLIFGKQQPRV